MDKNKTHKIGVVIVTFNRCDLLRQCISCVLYQTAEIEHIVIVDNCSTDHTPHFLSELQKEDAKITVLTMPTNIGGAGGFSKGLSYLVKHVNVDWCLLIDDDALIHHDYLSNIFVSLNTHPNILAASGSVLQGGAIDFHQRRRIKPGIFYKTETVPPCEYGEESFYYDLTSFCGVVISADLVREIGFPEEKYFIWYDDTEYSFRIREKTKIMNVNHSVLDHATTGIDYAADRMNWKLYYGYRNRLDLISKYYGQTAVVREIGRILWIIMQNLQLYLHKCSWDDGRYNIALCLDSIHDFVVGKYGINNKYLG